MPQCTKGAVLGTDLPPSIRLGSTRPPCQAEDAQITAGRGVVGEAQSRALALEGPADERREAGGLVLQVAQFREVADDVCRRLGTWVSQIIDALLQ